MTFEEVKKDYLELKSKWGFPDDMTGAFVMEESLEKIMLNPSRKASKEWMISVFQYGFQNKDTKYHTEFYRNISIYECELIKRIYEKYILL